MCEGASMLACSSDQSVSRRGALLIDRRREFRDWSINWWGVSPLSPRLQGCTSAPLFRWTLIITCLSASTLACLSDQSIGQRKRCIVADWSTEGVFLLIDKSTRRSFAPLKAARLHLCPPLKMDTSPCDSSWKLVVYLLALFACSVCLRSKIDWLHLFGLSKGFVVLNNFLWCSP